MTAQLDALLSDLRACRVCRDAPLSGSQLPHEPRPVIQASVTARILVAGQAPGTRVHASGKPFTDPSGDRLRSWMDVDGITFYDASRIAIVPMGHCFPGLDARGADLPPRKECAPRWRAPVLAALPEILLVLVIGQYARNWHLPEERGSLTQTVENWRQLLKRDRQPQVIALPHPSWRNSGWLKRHPWFETELLPVLREEVRKALM